MTAFDKAWDFLKADPIDMHEYPPGSSNFMPLQDMIETRNADARKNMERMHTNMNMYRNTNPNVGGQPSTNAIAGNQQRNNIMVNSETGVYDPNDPNSWHPM